MLKSYLPQQAYRSIKLRKLRLRAHRRLAERDYYPQYKEDPVGFGRDVLGEVFTEDIEEVMESLRDVPVTVVKSSNAVGKTHGAARGAVWFYKCFEDSQVYTTATPFGNLRRQLWGEIDTVVANNPDLFPPEIHKITSLNIERILLRSGEENGHLEEEEKKKSFITGVAIPASGTPEQREAKFSGKHAKYILFIVDEGDAVPREVYRAIESSMSGGIVARLLVMFNPKAEMGPIYEMERDGKARIITISAFTHPNVVTGDHVIPGAVDRNTTVRRIHEWSRPLVEEEKVEETKVFEVPKFLVGCSAVGLAGDRLPPLQAGRREITNPALSYMVLARYPAEGVQQLIPTSAINMAVARWHAYVAEHGEVPPPAVTGIWALDVAELGKDKNALCFRNGGYVAPFYLWEGIDPDATAIRCAELIELNQEVYRFEAGAVDALGVGAGVPARMSRLDIDGVYAVKVSEKPTYETELGAFFQLRDQIWWSMSVWLRKDPGAMLPPDDELLEDLKVPIYEVKNGKIKISSKDVWRETLGRSPDRGDALALTFAPITGAWVQGMTG